MLLVLCVALLLSPFVALLVYASVSTQQRRLLCSIWLTAGGLVSCGVVIYVQTVLNQPDVGMAFQQLYLPAFIFLGLSVLGGVLCHRAVRTAQ